MDKIVIVRGAGDIATGVIHVLHKFNYNIIALEIESPTVIRRTVSFADCVFGEATEVEGVRAVKCKNIMEALHQIDAGNIPVMIDEQAQCVQDIKPVAVVDAILAKRNCGTHINMAPVVVAVGPGFEASVDAHYVVETQRGHDLGRVIAKGFIAENTGIPGNIMGYTIERVLKSQNNGIVRSIKNIGDIVKKNDIVAYVGDIEVRTQIDGVLRGMIRDGICVPPKFKIADVDPRGNVKNCYSISDKARLIGFGVLEALFESMGSM